MERQKVLLVDDEEEFSSALAERLRLRGFDVTTTADGKEAIRRVSAHPPGIVLLDVKMPGLGGLEVLRRIKSEQPNIPVILLTGLGSSDDGAKGMQLGAFDYLMKPVRIEALMERINDAVGGTGPGRMED
jgi:two-component system, OmpR family, response regulator